MIEKRAIVTGANGNQGKFLCELLVEKGYQVHGVIRQYQDFKIPNVFISKIEMTDVFNIVELINFVQPHEVYNLAAFNDVAYSFLAPAATMDVNCGGFLRIVESVRLHCSTNTKIYMALSSEMFGNPVESPQNENTPLNPRSPYGVSKTSAYAFAKMYREKYNMNIYCGILFNNESERRPEQFLSKKVCQYVGMVYNKKHKEKLKLGNLEARRDFGYAKEYVEWTWRIMQHETPDDFILATGVTHSVAEFVETAFKYVNIDNWRDYIEVDQSLYRPSEEKLLVGDASKSKRLLNFAPKTTFKELISIMMEHELKQYDII